MGKLDVVFEVLLCIRVESKHETRDDPYVVLFKVWKIFAERVEIEFFIDGIPSCLVETFKANENRVEMGPVEKVEKLFIAGEICPPEKKAASEHKVLFHNASENLLRTLSVTGKVVVLKAHILKSEFFVIPEFFDNVFRASLPVGHKHSARTAKVTPEVAPTGGENVRRFNRGF